MGNEIIFIYEKTKTGYSAYARDYAAYTTGNDLSELKLNCLECINLHFEETVNEQVSIEQIKLVAG